MLMFLSGLIFVAIILLMAMRASATPITDFELKQRIEKGNKRAEDMLLKKQLAPTFNFGLRCAVAILAIILVLFLREMASLGQAFLLGCGLILAAGILGSFKISRQIARDLLKKIEPKLLKVFKSFPAKIKRRILRIDKQQNHPTFYSKDELIYLIEKNQKVLSQEEENWLTKIFTVSGRSLRDVMTSKSDLKIIHQTDFLGPLMIDELHKTGQNIFVVTGKSEEKVEGILGIDRLANIDSKTSQIAKNIMNRDYFSLSADQGALDAFQQMLLEDQQFAVVQDSDDLLGVVNLSNFYSQK